MTMQRASLWFVLAGLLALPLAMSRAEDEVEPDPLSPFPRTKAADRARSARNLKEIGLAFHAFHDVNNAFPAAITDKNGKALLSWRVALLPFLDEQKLYRQFKLDEPWDSKHNKKLLEKIPKVFAPTIQGKPAKPYTTYYQVFTGPDAPFNPKAVRVGAPLMLGPRMANFTDGLTNTALVVEAGEAVPWTKPDDIKYDARKPRLKLGGLFKEGFHVVRFDGSVVLIGRHAPADAIRAMITPDGDEEIDWNKLSVKPAKR
jgi:hypothetical protein